MKILVLKTDGPTTYLATYDDLSLISELHWESGRELARDILKNIRELLQSSQLNPEELEGILCFSGPGSFTSLRIGITVANTLAYAQNVPIVSTTGDDWVVGGINQLLAGANEKIVVPLYGAEPTITVHKK